MTGCGQYIFGRRRSGINQRRVSGTPEMVETLPSVIFSHFAKSAVPGKSANETNCANAISDRCATAAVASKVSGRSLGKPKINEPSACTLWQLGLRVSVASTD